MNNLLRHQLVIKSNNKTLLNIFNDQNTDSENSYLSFNSKIPIPNGLEYILDFKKIIKMKPDDLKSYITNQNTEYGWKLHYWGTQKDCCSHPIFKPIYKKEEDYIYYIFVTFGTPPIEWLNSISKQYPNLIFKLNSQIEKIYDNKNYDEKYYQNTSNWQPYISFNIKNGDISF